MSIDGKRSTPRQGFAFRNTYDMLTSVDILAFGLQGSVVQRAVTTQRNEELAFAVLADQVRRQILDTLASHGECSAGFISDQISTVGRTTVSTHLRALRLSGVVLERRQGRHRLYSIDPMGPANDALQFLRGLLERALGAKTSDSPMSPTVDPDGGSVRRRA
ncbi:MULTISPECIES: ArsR/SmtB family transcription factor [Rhodococcus]|uniref:ArsR/SmtB family transcription factor n=1 Tax=Rhodococcus TaxID=1827 RepID=UPI001ED8DE7D|nr:MULTISPECIES: winged helix-turn-helix domain-containing protein [Rhodococcus]